MRDMASTLSVYVPKPPQRVRNTTDHVTGFLKSAVLKLVWDYFLVIWNMADNAFDKSECNLERVDSIIFSLTGSATCYFRLYLCSNTSLYLVEHPLVSDLLMARILESKLL